ncbi:MAG: mannitol dehydrogenase family protein [Treponema sp.]|nr:mannitol dehydrogenase family protein [Treponema sp.]
MKLRNQELAHKAQWAQAGIKLPQFDREAMIAATRAEPGWVHFGSGNIFRIFGAALQQTLLDKGLVKTGIIMVAGRNGEILDRVFKPCDNLTLGVTLKNDGTIEKKVIASVADSLWMGNTEDFEELARIFRSPSLQMASFSITEKAYNIEDKALGQRGHYLSDLTLLLLERYKAGAHPLALVSMDNCAHNGAKLSAVVRKAASLISRDRGFIEYMEDTSKISFPWTMIDMIVPSPDPSVQKILEDLGFRDTEIYRKDTVSAPFVNAEETQYLVIEDDFPNGRPPLEGEGVFFTDRDTVNRAERMKVQSCLNPLHSTLAIFGCLLGYTLISEEMRNPLLVKLIETIGYKEGMPVVEHPGIIDPQEFIRTAIQVRLPNPFLPDTPQRIAVDLSQKITVRFGETIKAYLASETLRIEDLNMIPLVLAGWVRYLMGLDDQGNPFQVSADPLYAELYPHIKDIGLGQKGPFPQLRPIFSDARIFAVDLYQAGLGEKAEAYFEELVAGPGAVKRTLEKYCG